MDDGSRGQRGSRARPNVIALAHEQTAKGHEGHEQDVAHGAERDADIRDVRHQHRMGQQGQDDSLTTGSSSFLAEQASFLKLLVEKGKGTDHGAALVRWAALAFARHNPAGPMEETSMS